MENIDEFKKWKRETYDINWIFVKVEILEGRLSSVEKIVDEIKSKLYLLPKV